MPVYVYQCAACGERQEQLHSILADPDVRCAECGNKCRRVIQPFIIHIKTPVKEIRFKREEAQRIRGNREIYEGDPDGFERNREWREKRDRRNAALMARAEAKKRRWRRKKRG